ncbi:MAG: type III-A CRISPR-associated RAMP protein Csm3 [Chloroflexi bacterium]|nr:type III-A CRISPR-associated RAMP protein Csm3 [Chloroflexota bacterium]
MPDNSTGLEYVNIKKRIVTKSGISVGAPQASMAKMTVDTPVIRDLWGNPYIPGSSIKGKMRSLLEHKYNRIGNRGDPCGCGQPLASCPICTIFGPHKKPDHNLGPTRIIVRDAPLSQMSQQQMVHFANEGKEFSEVKTETMVSRQTGMAAGGSLRSRERIAVGTEFALEISLRIFSGDDKKRILEIVNEGLELLRNDTLGGSGSRGYGWIDILD